MQLKFTSSLMLMAFVAIASEAFGQEKDPFGAEYSKCIERSGGADPGMLDCIKAEADRQDKRFNDAYKKLMNELKSDRKRQLQQVQRMWIKYIEANCDFYLDPDDGTAARLAASECPVLWGVFRNLWMPKGPMRILRRQACETDVWPRQDL